MKKFQYYLTAIFFALFTTVSFSACSDDDDDNNPSTTQDLKTGIVGTWQATHVSGWIYENEDDEEPTKINQDIADKTELAQRFLFSADGTCRMYFYSEETDSWLPEEDTYTYEVVEKENKIVVYDSNKDVEQIFTVLSLEGDTVVLQYYIDDEEHQSTVTCKKVK